MIFAHKAVVPPGIFIPKLFFIEDFSFPAIS